MLCIGITALLFQALQLTGMLDITARQLLLIKHRLLLQFSTQLLVLLRGSGSWGATSLLLLFQNTQYKLDSQEINPFFSHPNLYLSHL